MNRNRSSPIIMITQSPGVVMYVATDGDCKQTAVLDLNHDLFLHDKIGQTTIKINNLCKFQLLNIFCYKSLTNTE